MDDLERREEKDCAHGDSDTVTGDPDASGGYDSDVPLPSVSELRQCELEVGALLQIISELNAKMGSLQAPRDGDECEGRVSCSTPDFPPSPGPLLRPVEEPGIRTSAPVTKRGDSGEVWAELQEALSTLERSANRERSLVTVPQPLRDEETRTRHLSAAQESWVKVTQVLEEMERELGFSYRSALPSEERQRYQRDVLELHRHNGSLRSALQSRQQELGLSDSALHDMEDEKKKLQEKLLVLKRRWLVAGSLSPPRSPSSSSSGAVSPSWASPPFPGSPLLLRRHVAAFPAVSTGGDVSPSSGCPSPSPSPVLPGSPSLESETDRLQRCLERLKARNERLSAALERRKGESEQISMALSQHEADNTALQMALRYCAECEETYADLLGLYQRRRGQGTAQATEGKGRQLSSPQPEFEKLPTNTSTAEGAMQRGKPSHTRLAAEDFSQQTESLKEKITGLRQDRAALRIPEQGPVGGGKMSPDTGTLAGPRGHNTTASPRGEKAALLYELVTVREEMSELRGAIRLTEKEKRCLEWTLMAQRAQDEAGALLLDSLKEELEERSMEQQRVSNTRERSNSGGGIPGPRNRTIFRELQAVLQREHLMKRRVTALRDSLDTKLSDGTALRRQSDEEAARLTDAHSKISNMYRNARRKHREQIWRLEKQMAALSERHMTQITELQATLENLEDRREETVL
ncbi:colorectal mutant cancer protein isoform X2 [Sardina pilchardus]|uniref:colorectal mutant cancer protein isoform X2 n=1 Tax=Sardina pilchardus TaxID=27697 RepID=UPI002E0D3C6E